MLDFAINQPAQSGDYNVICRNQAIFLRCCLNSSGSVPNLSLNMISLQTLPWPWPSDWRARIITRHKNNTWQTAPQTSPSSWLGRQNPRRGGRGDLESGRPLPPDKNQIATTAMSNTPKYKTPKSHLCPSESDTMSRYLPRRMILISNVYI